MKAWIERALNIMPGDLGRGLLLCACLFLVITNTVIGKVAGAALFLSKFKATQLPFVDIVGALAVALIVGSYVVIARRVSASNLVAGSLCFYASNCVVFWVLTGNRAHSGWLFSVFYVWARVVGILGPTQIWTLANGILTTREAKRIFGMVGSGAILGWIFAGFLSKTIIKAFGTERLLLAMAVLYTVCAVLVIITWRYGRARLSEAPSAQKQAQPAGSISSLRQILESPYLRAIAAVICISSFMSTLIGWQFMAITQQFIVGKDALAAYFAGFNLYTGLLSLFFQVVLTTRFVRRFGIGISLALLPVVILFGATGLLVLGTLNAALALRGSDQILRYSIDRSTTELLYLPIPARIKLQVKWFIDTVIWRLGDATAGFTVLIFATFLGLHARQLSWITMLMAAAWLVAVVAARREYVVTLKQNVTQHKIEAEQVESMVLDRSTSDLLATSITASDPKDILYALDLMQVDRRSVHPAVRTLLGHPAPEVRSRAILILSDAGDKSVRSDVERLLHDPDINVRTDALLYLSHNAHVDPLEFIQNVSDFEDFSISSAVVAYLGRPGVAQNVAAASQILAAIVADASTQERTRIEVARLLGDLPDRFDPLLATLVADPKPSVAREAIRTVGKLRKVDLAPRLLDCLSDPLLGSEAAKALAVLGDDIVGLLHTEIGNEALPVETRREIPAVLLAIGTLAAARVLFENILQSDCLLRFSIIRALNKLHRLHPQMELDFPMIETVLAAEILGHYRSFQILHALCPSGEIANGTDLAMAESMEQERERIFRLLALLHPSLALDAAYMGLQSKNISVCDNALEFLENVLKTQLRETLLPLLDSRVSVAEKARIASRLVRNEIGTREEAVAALVASDDPWLRSCGAYAIGSLGITVLEDHLDRCLNDPDPLLREVARAAKARLDASTAHA